MIVPLLAIAQPTNAICKTVACGPAGLACSPTGSPAAAHAVSHSVISFGLGISDFASGKSKFSALLKPNFSEEETRPSAPIWSPSCANTVLAESSVARCSVIVPYDELLKFVTLPPPMSSVEGESY